VRPRPQAPAEAQPEMEPVVAAPVALEPVQTADYPAWEAKGVRTAFSRAGNYLLKWKPVGGKLPKNKHFEIDLWLFKAGDQPELLSGATIATRGWMPEHGHGMVRQPRSEDLGGGHYRISGMLLHMGGYWQLYFDVVLNGVAESTQFDVTL